MEAGKAMRDAVKAAVLKADPSLADTLAKCEKARGAEDKGPKGPRGDKGEKGPRGDKGPKRPAAE